MKEKLTEQQKTDIVAVMDGIAGRCQGDTDEKVGVKGQELKSLLTAFGRCAFEGYELKVLDSPENVLNLREHYFIGRMGRRGLIRNAREIYDITQILLTQILLQGKRQELLRSFEGL